MTLVEFDNAVRASGELKVLGMREDDVLVRNTVHGHCWTVPLEVIASTPENQLMGVLLMRRPAQCLRHVSRIVGYYSSHHAWNKSKLAELKDRHKGTYALPETSRSLNSQSWPKDVVEEQLTGHADDAVCDVDGEADSSDPSDPSEVE